MNDAKPAEARSSLLMRSASARRGGAFILVVLLWLAVAWAMGEPA